MGLLENRASRRLFGPRKEEVTVGRRTLQNEEVNTVIPV
jgi:hypothetical protein